MKTPKASEKLYICAIGQRPQREKTVHIVKLLAIQSNIMRKEEI